MKTIKIIIFIIAICTTESFAQDKYDNIWLMGADPNIPELKSGGSYIDFSQGSPTVTYFDIPFDFGGNTSICDSSGRLQMYSNGCQIMNAAHQLMTNGDSINPGEAHEIYCDYGYPVAQSLLTLPYPGHPGWYVMFHLRFHEDYYTFDLLHSIINMNTADGLGRVESKNIPLGTAQFVEGLTAVKHGNGRDWWIILPVAESNAYWTWLLSPNGVTGPQVQQQGNAAEFNYYRGTAVFSPDGSRYVHASPITGVKIFNFERCTGILDSLIEISLADLDYDSISYCRVSISPNSRFLYLATGIHYYQYDLQSTNISNSRQLIAYWQPFYSPFVTSFFHQVIGPDKKIYMSTGNGNYVMHVIQNPNVLGQACGLAQNQFVLPTHHRSNLPNFPHFRVYDLPGSPCDTLGIDGPVNSTAQPTHVPYHLLQVVPNPTTGLARLTGLPSDAGALRLTLVDALGRTAAERSSPDGSFDTTGLPAGLYVVIVRDGRGRVWRVRVAVQ
jgi:hypothetical protein